MPAERGPSGTGGTALAFVAEVGWRFVEGRLYVNADDLIHLLNAGGYSELADDFHRIAEEERRAR